MYRNRNVESAKREPLTGLTSTLLALVCIHRICAFFYLWMSEHLLCLPNSPGLARDEGFIKSAPFGVEAGSRLHLRKERTINH